MVAQHGHEGVAERVDGIGRLALAELPVRLVHEGAEALVLDLLVTRHCRLPQIEELTGQSTSASRFSYSP